MQNMHSPALTALAGIMGHTDTLYMQSSRHADAAPALDDQGRALSSGIYACLLLALSCMATLALVVQVSH